MELNLNARNPGEFFAGVGLMHVLGAAGRWREDCAALDLPDVAQAEVNRPMLRNADRFDAAWPSESTKPINIRWGRIECTLMWWAAICCATRTDSTQSGQKIKNSKLKTYAGNRSAKDLLEKLIDMLPHVETWPEALIASTWTRASPFKTDARVIATSSAALGFSPDRLHKVERIRTEMEIYPWVDLLANVGLHMTAVTESVYQVWHYLVPARCTAAAVIRKTEATEVSFRVTPTHTGGSRAVYKRFAI